MMKYVVGLAFNEIGTELLLIEKKRPQWQEGLLNGVGGKVETTDASFKDAMIREFEEEACITITDWREVATNLEQHYELVFFTTFTNEIYNAKSMTDEQLQIVDVDLIPQNYYPLAPNIDWLTYVCLDGKVNPFTFSNR